MTRAEILQQALDNNPGIIVQTNRLAASTEEVGIRRATYYPQITLNLAQLYLNTPVLGISFPNEQPLAPEAILPTFTQELFEFGRRRNQVKAAVLKKEARRWMLQEARLGVLWKAAMAFDQLAMYQHLLQAAVESERAARKHLDRTRLRLEKGLAIFPDLTQAKVYWQKSRLQVVQIRNSLHKAQADLVYVTGHKKFRPFRAVESTRPELLPENPDVLVDSAMRQRPLLVSLRRKDREKNALVNREFDAHLPKLDLFANGLIVYGLPSAVTLAPQSSGLFFPGFQTGVVLSVPIFSGMSVVHRTEEARSVYRREVADTRLAEIRVARNVRKAWFDLETQKKKIDLDRTELENATINREMIQRSYDKGLVDSVTRIQAQAEYVTAHETLIADRFRLRMILDELEWQVGEWPPDVSGTSK
uniref:Putative outer membrane efflux protein n=1 Tax=Leptospirillum sp. Group II '5-way CG' TaxID=419541 RepID=B6ANG1_9BACT|nr:MAG: Putative outer membrane efflux protein [Leptospirillum sp. Group II '5-way CG']